MKKIAIVQGHKQQCGVYQYGLSTYRILQKSKRYEYVLVPVSGPEEFVHKIGNIRPDAILFNYESSLLRWYDDYFAEKIPCPKFMMVGHEPKVFPNFYSASANFVISPIIRVNSEKFFNIPRPVVDLDHVEYKPPIGPIKIGNFGFGWYTKEYAKIINRVNSQFIDEHVILNFNIGLGDYVDITGKAAKELADECRKLVNPNIELNISHNFLEIDQLIEFLNQNDINIFYYSQDNNDGIVSSSTDYALAAKKPIGVNNSSMFRHILSDAIDINKTPIKNIIDQGLNPLSPIHQAFSEDNFRNCFEVIFARFL